MALDEALMYHACETEEWIFRVYSWSRPTLSLGRNQSARGGYDLERLRSRDIDVVRRPTGGRAILHHHEITYSVTAPIAEAGDLRESYARINRLLITALRALGVDANVAGVADTTRTGADAVRRPPGLLPCFHHPSPGEIMLAGRKLAGSAQWRCDRGLLQHGSILIENDQMQLSALVIGSTAEIPIPATLTDALGRTPSERELTDALFGAVRTIEDPRASELAMDDRLDERTGALCCRYLDPDWTWRR